MVTKEEVNNLIKRLLSANKEYSKDNIIFIDYCKTKMQDRGIEESLVIETLNNSSNLYYAEKQEVFLKEKKETRHKLIYKISSKYSLIIIVVYEERILKVVNVIKTSKSAEKLWRKKISE